MVRMSSCKELFWHRFCSYHQRITEEVFSVKEIVTIMLSVLIFVIALSCEQSQKKAEGTESGSAFAVRENGKWGYADETGKYVLTPQFEGAVPLKEGFAQVRVNGTLGHLDKAGKYVWGPVN